MKLRRLRRALNGADLVLVAVPVQQTAQVLARSRLTSRPMPC
jgi:prephenate dehydrogenase